MNAPPTSGLTEQRLDWRVLVVHTVTFRQARAILSSAGPIAVVVAVQGNLGSVGLIGIAVAATLASLAFSVLRWWRFSYQIDAQRLLVRQGLLTRSERAVPLDRVRGVDVEASALHRLFRIAVLRVDAAAGTGGNDEAVLDAVSATDARRLRELLLVQRAVGGGPAVAQAPEVAVAPDVAAERVFARLDPRWLLYAPLVGSYLAVPLAIGGTLLRDVGSLPIPTGLRDLVEIPEGAGAGRIALSLIGALAVVAVGALLAGAVANWGFVLAARGSNLVAERGLLTRRTVSLEIDRIRGYVLSQGLGLRLVRAARLTALVTGLGDQNRRGQLLPLGPLRVAEDVAASAVRRFDTPLRPHPSAALRRRLLRAVGPPALIAVVLLLVDLPVAATVAAVVAVAGVALGIDRYHALGHAADAAALAVRSGSVLRRRVVLEQRALVGWRVRQSWFQRRAGLVTVIACVGAGEGGYDVLDCGTGQGLDLVTAVSPGWAGPLTTH
ncbi:MAG: PH domain-containing protein [Geodermatophilaceae bacterium]|nr:PH domain-containing protein [Geodermatophilaceae bacterium]